MEIISLSRHDIALHIVPRPLKGPRLKDQVSNLDAGIGKKQIRTVITGMPISLSSL